MSSQKQTQTETQTQTQTQTRRSGAPRQQFVTSGFMTASSD